MSPGRRVITGFLWTTLVLPGCDGCKSGASSGPAGDAGSAAGEGPSAKVTKADCAKWADHGVDVMFSSWRDAAGQCPPEVQAALAEKLEGQRVTVHEAAVQLCESHAGESYGPADGRCYLAAATAKALLGCQLRPMTNPKDTDMLTEFDKLRASCTKQAPTNP